MSPASAPRRRYAAVLLGSALGIVALAQSASAQQDPGANAGQNQGQGQGQGQGGRRRGGPGGFDPAQFRQRMEERMKQTLGATDDEWKVLQPRIEKVRAAQRQNGGGRGMGMIFGGRRGGPSTQGAPDGGQGQNGQGGQNGRGGRGGRGPGGRGPGPDGQTNDSAVAVKVRELQQAVESNAGPDEIKAKMAALRDAKAKAREQVAQAQAELREVLTAKQEGALIVMGVLE